MALMIHSDRRLRVTNLYIYICVQKAMDMCVSLTERRATRLTDCTLSTMPVCRSPFRGTTTRMMVDSYCGDMPTTRSARKRGLGVCVSY